MSEIIVDFIDKNQARRMGVLAAVELDGCIVKVAGRKQRVPNERILNKYEKEAGNDTHKNS